MSRSKFDWKSLIPNIVSPLAVMQSLDKVSQTGRKGSIGSLWNKLTGAGTTAQQDALNAYEAEQAQINRDWQTQEADLNRRFQSEQAQLDYDRQVEFYDKYQSIGAQMRQYKENGLNPMLLAGGVQPSASMPSTSVPSGSMPSGSSARSTSPVSGVMNLSQMFSQILSLAKLRSEIGVNESIANKNNSDAENTQKHTSWIDTLSSLDVQKTQQDIRESEERVNNLLASTAKLYSDIDVNNKTIDIGNARISLMGSQEELNQTQAILNRLNAEKMSILMPYVKARAEAEIAYTNAKTQEAKAAAERHLHESSLALVQQMKEQKLLDSGYYDSIVTNAEWTSKTTERKYHWSPINDICSNFSKICIGVGSVIGSIKGTSSMPFTSFSGSADGGAPSEVPDIYL